MSLQQLHFGDEGEHTTGVNYRRLLGSSPPGGGFQAAKYFTYIFFALAIALITMMIIICGLHCSRRMRLSRRLEATEPPNQNLTVPSQSGASARRREQPVELVPIKIFTAVTVCHPDGTQTIAWSTEKPEAILQPESAAARKAARDHRCTPDGIYRLPHEERRGSGRRHRSEGRTRSSTSLSTAPVRVGDAVSRHLPQGGHQLQRPASGSAQHT